jgi:hypothetical protein
LTIGLLSRDDARAAAGLHKRNFPDDLFTLAGERVLVRLFDELASEASLVANLDGRLVGYSAGTLNKSRFMKRMIRRHMPVLVAGIALAILRRPYEAPGYVRGLLRWLVRWRTRARDVIAVSMYEAISKDARALGIPPLFFLQLHAAWIVHCEQLGAQEIEGQVTDKRMLAALSRLGYRLDRTVAVRGGSKHYIRCRLPVEAAHRWAQAVKAAPPKRPAAEGRPDGMGQMPSPPPTVPELRPQRR